MSSPASKGLLSRAKRFWNRRGDASVSHLLATGSAVLAQLATAPFFLRKCDRVGRRPRTLCAPRIVNEGHIEIGDDVVLLSRWCPVEIVTSPHGRIEIGNDVHINYATLISAQHKVRLGNRVQIGQYVIISDTEAPAGSQVGPGEARPIEIGDDVWLAGRVTVLPGVKIGTGAVVTAGSLVCSDLPPRVVAGGVPARVLRQLEGAEAPASPTARKELPTLPATNPLPVAHGTLVADFTIDAMARFLADGSDNFSLLAEVAPFGQVTQSLLAGPSPGASDFAVVWTRPETAVTAFARVLGSERVSEDELLEGVDTFAGLVLQGAGAWRQVLVPSWTLPPDRRGLGVIDARLGATRALSRMNLRLMERLHGVGNVFVLDAQRWVAAGGRSAQNPRAWFIGKVAFGDAVLGEAARDVKAAVRAVLGGARKLVILDLDDTLWGGVVGDVGWPALRLGGHDPVGEALVDFQQRLKALTRRGVLLAIVSKNEEATALEAIRSHPGMVLRQDDFVAWRIDWQDKAHNIADLVAELNLGLQSAVFIDDNPVERGRVREALPEVFVPEWPADKLLYPSALEALRCFDQPSMTTEDAQRTQLYASERRREKNRVELASLDAWLERLDTRVRAEPLAASNLPRVAQLLNKTNQMNLSTRRLTEDELLAWARESGHSLWALSVADRFGDVGLTGIISLDRDGEVGRIVDYVLSCRVMGRKVEETMVHMAVEASRAAGLRYVEARLIETKKNNPCRLFWKATGFSSPTSNVFRWETSRPYLLPACIHLTWQGGPA